MATNKTVTVTVLPTLTGDTVASYNVYEGVSGTTLLGTMSVAEAAAGKVFAFTDGIVHSVKTQTVWTTAGASTIRSAGVELDLASSIIIEQDDFTGTSGSILVPTNPNTVSLTLSQNDGLFAESLSVGNGTIPDAGDDWNDYFKHATGFAVGGTYVMSFDMEMSQNDGSNHLFGFTTVLGGDVVQIHDAALWTGIDATNLRAYQRTSNVFTQDTNVVLDASVRRTYKVAIEGANCSFYYWNGSSWTQVGTITPHGLTGTLYPFFLCRTSINTVIGQTAQVHNYFLSDVDFLTQYPS